MCKRGNETVGRSVHSVVRVLCAVFSAMGGWPGVAAPLTIQTEGFGDINDTLNGRQNQNGAMIWNGQAWVVNDTWAHKYFIDASTGNRLKTYNAHDTTVTGAPDAGTQTSACAVIGNAFAATGYGNFYPPDTFQAFSITRQAYTYTKTNAYGTYCYGAVEYVIQHPVTGKTVVLKSRGVGSGAGQAYFDVYIEDDLTTGLPYTVQTTAMRGDPAWYTYPGMSAQAAKNVADTVTGRSGDLPGAVSMLGTHDGDYFLDVNNGSDMGGKSYELHANPLANAFDGPSPAYITGFEYKWMDDLGNLQKITVSPTLFKEVVIPNPNHPVPIMPLPWLIGLGSLLAGFGTWAVRRLAK